MKSNEKKIALFCEMRLNHRFTCCEKSKLTLIMAFTKPMTRQEILWREKGNINCREKINLKEICCQ
jgi:hypothetical protein